MASKASCGGKASGDGNGEQRRCERESEWEAERVRASGEAAGVFHFTPANAQHGQGQSGVWWPCSGNGLWPVSHCAGLKILIQSSLMPTDKASS